MRASPAVALCTSRSDQNVDWIIDNAGHERSHTLTTSYQCMGADMERVYITELLFDQTLQGRVDAQYARRRLATDKHH